MYICGERERERERETERDRERERERQREREREHKIITCFDVYKLTERFLSIKSNCALPFYKHTRTQFNEEIKKK